MVASVPQHQLNSNLGFLLANPSIHPTSKMNFPQTLLRPLEQWTREDVQLWIEYCIDEYSLADVNRRDFQMNGKALLLLNEESFRQRAVRSGDVLYRALQQHNTMIKSINQQVLSSSFWNNYPLPIPRHIRHFNQSIVPSPSYPMSAFHSTSNNILSHPSMTNLHPAFNYLFNHRDPDSFSTRIPHQSPVSAADRVSNSNEKSKFSIRFQEETTQCQRQSPMKLPSRLEDLLITTSPDVKKESLDDEDIDIEDHDQLVNESKCSTIRQDSKTPSNSLKRSVYQPNDVTNTSATPDQTRRIHYYNDRIDFRGDILLKPAAAKNCRILWEFLYILLEDPEYESVIHWEDREKRIFRIVQADKLAALWGLQKNRLTMTYEKLSRGMRYYYSNNIISKEQSKRLLYRFMRSPDEIRKSMKRPAFSHTMFDSLSNKTCPSSPESTVEPNDSHLQTTSDEHTIPLTFSSIESSASYTEYSQKYDLSRISIDSNIKSTLDSAQYLSPRFYHSESNFPNRKRTKSDQSNNSTPDSFDSHHERSIDNEKQFCSPSQSLSSSISSSSTSTKRKQAVPKSLKTRLSDKTPPLYQLSNTEGSIDEQHEIIHAKRLKSILTHE